MRGEQSIFWKIEQRWRSEQEQQMWWGEQALCHWSRDFRTIIIQMLPIYFLDYHYRDHCEWEKLLCSSSGESTESSISPRFANDSLLSQMSVSVSHDDVELAPFAFHPSVVKECFFCLWGLRLAEGSSRLLVPPSGLLLSGARNVLSLI